MLLFLCIHIYIYHFVATMLWDRRGRIGGGSFPFSTVVSHGEVCITPRTRTFDDDDGVGWGVATERRTMQVTQTMQAMQTWQMIFF